MTVGRDEPSGVLSRPDTLEMIRTVTTPEQFAEAVSLIVTTSLRILAQASGLPPTTVSGWTTGRHLPNPGDRSKLASLLSAAGVPKDHHDAWFEALQRARRVQNSRQTRSHLVYPGLRPYERDEEHRFFGRAALVAELGQLIEHIESNGSPRRLIVISGSSGAGKTSLIRAGLEPYLRTVDGGRPRAVTLGNPWLPSLPIPAPGSVARSSAGGRGVMIIDQTEALFADQGAVEAAEFLDRVNSIAAMPDGPTVVLVIRSSHRDHLAQAMGSLPVCQGGVRHRRSRII